MDDGVGALLLHDDRFLVPSHWLQRVPIRGVERQKVGIGVASDRRKRAFHRPHQLDESIGSLNHADPGLSVVQAWRAVIGALRASSAAGKNTRGSI